MVTTKNIAMIGSGFMGRAHTIALTAAPVYFPDLPFDPVKKVIVDINDELAAKAKHHLRFEESSSNWREVVERDDIDIVDICTPNNTHAEIAIAAARAGKHIFCEKPLARTIDEGRSMLDAVNAAGVSHMVAYNYRHTPAVAMAKKLIDEGRVGKILNYRCHYMMDFSADPAMPLSWRFSKTASGSGTLGDIGSHAIDMAIYLVGDIARVNSTLKTFIPERPLQTSTFDQMGKNTNRDLSGPKGKVDVDDYVLSMLEFENGVIGTLEASRNSYGRHNYIGFELHGSKGSIVFNYERMNELQVIFADDDRDVHGFRTIYTGPAHPYGDFLWPVPGINIGYSDIKLIEFHKFFKAIDTGELPEPNFLHGYKNELVCEAIIKASESRSWVDVDRL